MPPGALADPRSPLAAIFATSPSAPAPSHRHAPTPTRPDVSGSLTAGSGGAAVGAPLRLRGISGALASRFSGVVGDAIDQGTVLEGAGNADSR